MLYGQAWPSTEKTLETQQRGQNNCRRCTSSRDYVLWITVRINKFVNYYRTRGRDEGGCGDVGPMSG